MLTILLLLALTEGTVKSAGILFPRESETREVVSLDGLWKFSISPKGNEYVGYKEQWFTLYHNKWISMPVPSSYNDVTVNATIRDFVGWSWYQRSFFPPRRWGTDDQRVFLRFGSVHYNANVWLNGKLVGNHSGGHLPFEFDVTALLSYGLLNTVTVAVNNTLTQYTLPQGTTEHFNDTNFYPPGYVRNSYNFDFFNYAGIHRSVILHTTPQTYIEDVSVKTDIDGTTGIIFYQVFPSVNENEIASPVQCEVTLLDGSEVILENSSCFGRLHVEDAKLWWPVHMSATPAHLYTLQIRLLQDGCKDIYRMPVGIRTVSWGTGYLKLNSQPVYLRGFGKHEDSNLRGKGVDYVLLLRDYDLINWVGANCYRTSHYPYAEEAMDLADSLGIMVIAESPAVNLHTFDAVMLEKHKSVMREMILRDKNRPSIIMWSLSNEASTHDEKAGPYYKSLVDYVRSLDSTRPITFVTNQKVEVDQAAPFVDIIGINRYFSWYSDTGDLDLITYQVESEFTRWHTKFKKPVFISEYGADAISGFHVLPSVVWTEDYQANLLHQHFKAFDRLRNQGYFIGELIWNFADFATRQDIKRAVGNHKGIFTRERQPKEAAFVLRTRYHHLAANSANDSTSFRSIN